MESSDSFDPSFYERHEHAGRERARRAWNAGLGSEELAALQTAHLDALEQEKQSAIAAIREEADKALRGVSERAEELERRLGEIRRDQAAVEIDLVACRKRLSAVAASMSARERETAGSQDHHVPRNQRILGLAAGAEAVMIQYSLHAEAGAEAGGFGLSVTGLSAVVATAAGVLVPFLAGMWAHTGRRHRVYGVGAVAAVMVSIIVTVTAARVLTALPGTYFLNGASEWAFHSLLLLLLSGYAFFVGHIRQLAALTDRLMAVRDELNALEVRNVELASANKTAKKARNGIPDLRVAELARFAEQEERVTARFEVAARAFNVGVFTEARSLTSNARPHPEALVAVERRALESSFMSPPRIERLLVADHPTQVAPGDRVSVLMRIIVRGSSVPYTVGAALKDMDIPVQGVDVLLTLHVREGMLARSPMNQTLHVPQTGNSEPVLFEFEACRPGMLQVTATAWVGGTFVGELPMEISAEVDTRSTPTTSRSVPIGPLRATPGEVTLQLQRLEGRYQFQVLTQGPLYDMVPMGREARLDRSIEHTLKKLEELAGREQPDRVQARRLRSMGVELWQQLVPEPVKEQFWAHQKGISAFRIATDHDVIPWELLYPLSRDRDEGFLVEQFPVARRVYGQARCDSISIAKSAFVLPATSPQGAKREIIDVNRRLSRALRLGPGEVLRDAEDLLDWIDQGAPGLLHFACHNTFRSEEGGSCVTMEGGDFTPGLLTPAVPTKCLEMYAPLIFFNACRSAGAAYEYTQLMGWAGQFMAAGAGAFVGTLWGVPSARAVEFSEAFYESFVGERRSLGAAVMAARRSLRNPTDPTWLAYTVYGDPGATIT
ncbi:CHAT domain-containing protein [Streptomyces sp. NPDC014892]|uniref:CHAT domain-containing protein n=1 Tax=Streptomyces sp. NPDC014892 TaxID=3364930 RepID=UPI0036FBE62C